MRHLSPAEYWWTNAVFNIRRKSPTLRDRSRRSSGRRALNWEGPATECASSVARHSQLMSRMLTSGDVGDRNAAVDQVFQCSALQTLEHHDCELVLHSVWNFEPVSSSCSSCDSPWSYLWVPATRRNVASSRWFHFTVLRFHRVCDFLYCFPCMLCNCNMAWGGRCRGGSKGWPGVPPHTPTLPIKLVAR